MRESHRALDTGRFRTKAIIRREYLELVLDKIRGYGKRGEDVAHRLEEEFTDPSAILMKRLDSEEES